MQNGVGRCGARACGAILWPMPDIAGQRYAGYSEQRDTHQEWRTNSGKQRNSHCLHHEVDVKQKVYHRNYWALSRQIELTEP